MFPSQHSTKPICSGSISKVAERSAGPQLFWSDMATPSPEIAGDDSVTKEERVAALTECLNELTEICNEGINQQATDKFDFIVLTANSERVQARS